MANEETKVAVMQEQIVYIKKQVDNILVTLQENVKSHEQRFERLQQEMDKRFEGVHQRIDQKTDKVEHQRLSDILARVNWIVIVSVIGAILTLVVRVSE